MKTIVITLFAFCTLASCAQEKTVNKNSQTISWGGKAAVGGYAPEGTLNIKNIQAKIDRDTVHNLLITIDMLSLSQENERLTKHLRDKDFFHVNKYPEAIFELTEPFIIGSSEALKGKMTIKNKTQEEIISITAVLENGSLSIRFEHTMNRLDYGITFNSPTVFQKLKENAIADQIKLKGMLIIKNGN